MAVLSLAPLKRRYKWIKKFTKHKTSPGHYKIIMHGSEHTVDTNYTTEHDEEDDTAQQVKETFEEAQEKAAPAQLPEGTGRVVKAKTSWDKLVHDYGVAGGKTRAVKDGLSPNIPGKGKTWESPYEFDGPFGKGIDDIMFDKDRNPVILEYKGGGAKKGMGQMGREWVCRKIFQLRKRNDPMADILEKAMQDGKLTGRLYRTPVSHSGTAGDRLEVGEAILEETWGKQYKGKC